MAAKTRAELAAEIASLFANNSSGAISEADLRQGLTSLVDSLFNLLDDIPNRTGFSLQFDSPLGAIYNASTPSSSNTITISATNATPGGCAQFVSDGTEIIDFYGETLILGNAQKVGVISSLFVYFDGTRYWGNWLPGESAAAQPQLTTPTIALTAGDTELDYTISSQDANATDGVMQISDDQSTWEDVLSAEYDGDPATTSGTITKIGASTLSNGTEYFVRFKNTASGYTDSSYATDSETPAASAAPVTFTLSAGITEIPSGTYTSTAGSVYAVSTSGYAGAFDYEAIFDQDPNSQNVIIGFSTDGTNRDYNDSGNEWEGGGLVSLTDKVNKVVLGALQGGTGTYLYNTGDKLHIIRDGSDNVKLYYNATEFYDFGTISGTIYLHFRMDSIGKVIVDPKVTA